MWLEAPGWSHSGHGTVRTRSLFRQALSATGLLSSVPAALNPPSSHSRGQIGVLCPAVPEGPGIESPRLGLRQPEEVTCNGSMIDWPAMSQSGSSLSQGCTSPGQTTVFESGEAGFCG